jgi:hypothetical protein
MIWELANAKGQTFSTNEENTYKYTLSKPKERESQYINNETNIRLVDLGP